MVVQGVRFLLPVIVCQKNTLKNGYRFLVAWTLFNTFSTPSKLTDLAQTNPANLRKKDVKKPLSYRCRITKKAKDLAGVLARKEVIKGPRTNTSIFS